MITIKRLMLAQGNIIRSPRNFISSDEYRSPGLTRSIYLEVNWSHINQYDKMGYLDPQNSESILYSMDGLSKLAGLATRSATNCVVAVKFPL